MIRRCQYAGHDTSGERCPRPALPGRTTCARHHSAGRPGDPRPDDAPRLEVEPGEQTALTSDPPPLPAEPAPRPGPPERLFEAPTTIRGQTCLSLDDLG
jgi:hypothetical protein